MEFQDPGIMSSAEPMNDYSAAGCVPSVRGQNIFFRLVSLKFCSVHSRDGADDTRESKRIGSSIVAIEWSS